ncbi:hypothetical protein H1O16_gp432 [Burkholderia phage BcepSaruman]|uniref:Uncharacterized protein n=1 Tax=Burkholderia phage BcepSaruman TaxID=2530032 RepID=A0A4D5ZCR5_9CAUD|nr:hypothetical protein H1O16_gp432 [Burkholderia phage BcepSaruman]QBX06845.1 hypothetical protein BcepSaruman_432 [Burkholderia phage BcepSaruman]
MLENQWFQSAAQRRPDTQTMANFVYAFGRQWGGRSIVPRTTRESATLETATVRWGQRRVKSFVHSDNEFNVYIHYDTRVVWVWFNGNARKCETVDEWVAAVAEATTFYETEYRKYRIS